MEHRLVRARHRRGAAAWALDGGDGAVNYLTVYLIERTLSLDNLFVFLLIFGAFAVPHQQRGKLLFWGIVLALVMRGAGDPRGRRAHRALPLGHLRAGRDAAGAGLADPARRARGRRPRQGRTARFVRRMLPVGEHYHGARFFAREDGRRWPRRWSWRSPGSSTPTSRSRSTRSPPRSRSPPTRSRSGRRTRSRCWACARSSRSSRSCPALPLPRRDDRRRAGHRRVKLLIEDLYKVGPIASLAIVLGAFVVGITASILRDRRDPAGAAERRAAA